MLSKKIFAGGGLNFDDDKHLIPKNDWVDARNIRVNSTTAGSLGAVVNIKGTTFLNSPTPIGENDIVIGAKGFDNVDKIFYFTCDPIGNYDRIIQYNASDNTYTTLVTNLTDTDGVDVLKFSEQSQYQINHIDLVDEKYLFWTDNLNPPRMLDITKSYGIITQRKISAIKYAPNESPTTIFSIDNPTVIDNKIKDNNYQFKYRWIYWDNSKSAFSPVSKMSNQRSRAVGPLSAGLPEWYDSSLIFGYLGGGELVKGVELIAREGNTGDWVIIDSFLYDEYDSRITYGARFSFTGTAQNYNMQLLYNGNTYQFGGTYTPTFTFNLYEQIKANFDALGITDITCTVTKTGANDLSDNQFLTFTSVNKNVEYQIFTSTTEYCFVTQTGYLQDNEDYNVYVFTNFQPLSVIDQEDANRPFDYIPLVAGSQCLPNGNYLCYGDYVEGYDNVDIEATAQMNKTALPTPEMTVLVTKTGESSNFNFFGEATDGDIFFINRIEPENAEYVYAIPKNPNETSGDFVRRIAYLVGLYYENAAFVTTISDTGFVILDGIIGVKRYQAAILSRETKQGLKSGDEYQYGVVYIDEAGRFGAVNTSNTMTIKTDSLSRFDIDPNILNGIITIKSRPPAWAHKYAIVRTKRKRKDFFIQAFVESVTIGFTTALVDVQGTISKINDRFGTNLSYSWAKGDRIRFVYEPIGSGNDYVAYDSPIIGVDEDGKLKVSRDNIPKVFGGTDNGFYEIYRESAAENANLFWEIAEFGDVGNPGEENAYHKRIYTSSGNISQSASDPSGTPLVHICQTGDVWYKYRYLPIPPALEPLTGLFYNAVWCESPSFSDFNCDTFTTDVGRSNIQNAFEKQTRYPASIRFSLAYVAGTSINNINTFYQENFKDFGLQYGPIQLLDVDGNRMVVGQKLRVGVTPIFESVLFDKQDTENVAISARLINDITYYKYEAGIGDAPESYVRYGSTKYFVDKNRGLVCRLAENGITPISITAKANSYFMNILPGATYVNGGYDPENSEYLISIRGEDTITFSELSNRFSSFMDFIPTKYATLRRNLYSFELIGLYLHNSNNSYNYFYSTNYPSSFTFVDNEVPMQVKSYLGLSEVSNALWTSPEILTSLNQESNLVASDFEEAGGTFNEFEGGFFAGFMNDINSPGGIIEGDTLKGKWIKIKLLNSNTNFVYLLGVGINQVPSLQGNI